MDAVSVDMQVVGVRAEDAEDRVRWKRSTRCGEQHMFNLNHLCILKFSRSRIFRDNIFHIFLIMN